MTLHKRSRLLSHVTHLVSFAQSSGFHLYIPGALVERCPNTRSRVGVEEGTGEVVVVQMLVRLAKESRSEISNCLSG